MTEERAIKQYDAGSILEQVVLNGDLAKLSPADRVSYHNQVCASLGLNPLTRPFEYITLNGKLTLYARKDATDQLRRLRSVSVDKPDIRFEDDWIIVTVVARDAAGRCDSDVGVVNKKDMRGDFGNALMKAVTKAKRRVTLSICGLGMLDETEVETIPDARPVAPAVTVEKPAQLDAPTAEKPDNIVVRNHWIELMQSAEHIPALRELAAQVRTVLVLSEDDRHAINAAYSKRRTEIMDATEPEPVQGALA